MEEEKKIVLLLFPLIISKFDFQTTEKQSFFDISELRKRFLKNKGASQLKGEEMNKWIEADHKQEIKEFIEHDLSSKSILINYPNNENQLNFLNDELNKERGKITHIILLNVSNYQLILDIKKEYLICPLCEKIYRKEEIVKENEKFICPRDNNYQLLLEDVKEFNDYIIEYYLKNTELIIKKFLTENNGSVSSIINLDVNKKEEIFNGETQQKLLRIIDGL